MLAHEGVVDVELKEMATGIFLGTPLLLAHRTRLMHRYGLPAGAESVRARSYLWCIYDHSPPDIRYLEGFSTGDDAQPGCSSEGSHRAGHCCW